MTTPFLAEDRKTYTDSELVIIYAEKIKKLANLLDQQLGVPCAEIRWQQEKNELQLEIQHQTKCAVEWHDKFLKAASCVEEIYKYALENRHDTNVLLMYPTLNKIAYNIKNKTFSMLEELLPWRYK